MLRPLMVADTTRFKSISLLSVYYLPHCLVLPCLLFLWSFGLTIVMIPFYFFCFLIDYISSLRFFRAARGLPYTPLNHHNLPARGTTLHIQHLWPLQSTSTAFLLPLCYWWHVLLLAHYKIYCYYFLLNSQFSFHKTYDKYSFIFTHKLATSRALHSVL